MCVRWDSVGYVVLVWLTSSHSNHDDAYFFVHFDTQSVEKANHLQM